VAEFRLRDGVEFPGPVRLGTAAGEVVLGEGQTEFSVEDNDQLVADLETDGRFERLDSGDAEVDPQGHLSAYVIERLEKNELLRQAHAASGGHFPVSEDVLSDENVDTEARPESVPAEEGSIDDPNVPNANVPRERPDRPDGPSPNIPPVPDPNVGGENF